MTKYNFTQAGLRIGKSRSTISRAVQKGKLTVELDDSGNKMIDASEMIRVYGDQFNPEIDNQQEESTSTSQRQFEELQSQLASQYEQRITDLKEVNEQLLLRLEDAHKTTQLLESRYTEKQDWETLVETKTAQLANDTEKRIAAIKKEHREETQLWRQRAYHERDKSWWKKLFQKKKKRVGHPDRK